MILMAYNLIMVPLDFSCHRLMASTTIVTNPYFPLVGIGMEICNDQ